jgi:phosphoglycolate phosphatase (TIGR01487 family)
MVKAVAVDIDGTLTDEKRRLHLGAVEGIRRLESLGIPVILATGNILLVTETISTMVGTTGPIIAENGGIVKDLVSGRVHYLGDISKARAAFEHLEGLFDLQLTPNSGSRLTEIALHRTVPVEDLREALLDFDVDVVDTKFAIHIKDPLVSKGAALMKVSEIMGIRPTDMAAIGDSENDREMLAISKIGISVGEDTLGDVCQHVTKDGYGEGCVQALDFLMSIRQKDFI